MDVSVIIYEHQRFEKKKKIQAVYICMYLKVNVGLNVGLEYG